MKTEHFLTLNIEVTKGMEDWYILTSPDVQGLVLLDTDVDNILKEVVPVMEALEKAKPTEIWEDKED